MGSKDDMSKMNPQPLLACTCRDDKQKKRPPLFPDARRGISSFALASACLFFFNAALALNGGCPDSCPAPTTTTTNNSSEILRGLVWCSPAQAALAAALQLAGDRTAGRSLAVVTLAATVASHVLFARFAVIGYVATSADPIGVLWAVATGSYVFAAALATLVLSGILAVVLLGGDRVE